MKTKEEQNRVNTYLQNIEIRSAYDLLVIEKYLELDGSGLVLPNNIIINKSGISSDEFIQWYEKPQYPKTYVECAKILDSFSTTYIDGYKNALLEKLQELLICRDAYWKIAGEQMGLDKPWEPNWLNAGQDKYVLYTHNNNICANLFMLGNNILAFPTKEMRDAFYKNFKDSIKQCKELL